MFKKQEKEDKKEDKKEEKKEDKKEDKKEEKKEEVKSHEKGKFSAWIPLKPSHNCISAANGEETCTPK